MKKGQKVIVNGKEGRRTFSNEKGVIISTRGTNPPIGIEFETPKEYYHSCGRKCHEDHGYYVREDIITFQNTRGIKIETEKIVGSNGELYRKILSVKMLEAAKLPYMYLNSSEEVVFLSEAGSYIVCRNPKNDTFSKYSIGNEYPETKMQALLGHCHKAGDNLLQCNKTLKERKENWKGTETFII